MNIKAAHLELLDDIPGAEDQLGPHKRISNAICALIENNRSGGKTIGLEGEWGAGKSTVIRLISEHFKDSKHFHIVSYDTWVHSGDPLRKAFLFGLIDSLLKKAWISAPTMDGKTATDYWEKEKEKLAGRYQTSETKTIRKFTFFGKLLLANLLLIPAVFPMFNDYFKKWVEEKFKLEYLINTPQGAILLASGIAVLFPFAATVFGLIGSLFKKDLFESIFSLIVNKNTATECKETIQSINPTSVEFQDVFERVLSTGLQPSERRLILVIDNLDRLSETEANAVWALLRSFIDNPHYQSTDWIKKLWVIVPIALPKPTPAYDQNSLNFSSLPQPSVSKGDAFFEKVFQVRFSLPPPVLTSWKHYLRASSKITRPSRRWDYREDSPNIRRLFNVVVSAS